MTGFNGPVEWSGDRQKWWHWKLGCVIQDPYIHHEVSGSAARIRSNIATLPVLAAASSAVGAGFRIFDDCRKSTSAQNLARALLLVSISLDVNGDICAFETLGGPLYGSHGLRSGEAL
ncbi:MAG: hypothetical protein M1830_006522 [Pleopsidium flavum]|nr:MAG: hypothetical protein M1830_006522 [Pleopsidium flavum]